MKIAPRICAYVNRHTHTRARSRNAGAEAAKAKQTPLVILRPSTIYFYQNQLFRYSPQVHTHLRKTTRGLRCLRDETVKSRGEDTEMKAKITAASALSSGLIM